MRRAHAPLALPLRRGASMQVSRFVVPYRDVRPGEHILYSVLDDRYVGIDDATFAAIGRWTRDVPPADEPEREAQSVLVEDGFVVRGGEEDDERLRAHLDRA